MTDHLTELPGLLAPARFFYTTNLTAERGAFALEWINAFSHLPPDLRRGYVPHGGTLAQLHLGDIQRLSRDIDLLAKDESPIEAILDAVAQRYAGRLFTWEEDLVEGSEIPMRRFSVYFPNARRRDVRVPLKLDVSYVPIDLPTVDLPLSASAVYKPTEPRDAVSTLSIEAFVADKLPTLGFDTHGYARPVAMAEDGNPEHVWKQVHDLGGLFTLGLNIEKVLSLYRAGIDVRNQIKDETFSCSDTLDDAFRVCRIAVAAWAYPRNADVPEDDNYEFDVTHVHAGLGSFGSYVIGRAPAVLLSTSLVAFLVSLLKTLENGEDSGVIRGVIERTHRASADVRRAGQSATRDRLSAIVGGRNNPSDWAWPVSSREVFVSSPAAATYLFVAGRIGAELNSYKIAHRLSFEP